MSTENVEQLCARAKVGDQAAELELWQKAASIARKRAAGWVGRGGAGADDFQQAAWIALHDTIGRYREGGGFLALFDRSLRSAFNEAVFGGRGLKKQSDPLNVAASLDAPAKADGDTTLLEMLEDRAATETAEPFENVSRAELSQAVRRAVSRADLTPAERRMIALRYWDGLRQEQAARACGMSPRAGQRVEQSALRKLRHPDVSRPLRVYGL